MITEFTCSSLDQISLDSTAGIAIVEVLRTNKFYKTWLLILLFLKIELHSDLGLSSFENWKMKELAADYTFSQFADKISSDLAANKLVSRIFKTQN